MDSSFLKEQAMRCRSLAENADPFIKRRLLDLAEKYDDRLGRPISSGFPRCAIGGVMWHATPPRGVAPGSCLGTRVAPVTGIIQSGKARIIGKRP
jgi:hypothetical protein